MAQPPNNLPIEPAAGGPGIPPRQATPPPVPPQVPPPPAVKPPIATPPSPRSLGEGGPPTPSRPPEIQTMPASISPPAASMPKPMNMKKGEPEDIFSGIEAPEKISMGSEKPPLGPKKRGGAGKIILIIMIALLTIGAIGFAFWFFVLRDTGITTSDTVKKADVTETKTPETKTAAPTIPPPAANTQTNGLQIPTTTGETVNGKEAPVTTPPEGTKIPPPTAITGEPPVPEIKTPPADTDGDGLTDDRELELGLKPDNPDTDGDGLTDGDEVEKYGTNPLNPDTDGDGYADGSEVENGYNPRGEGKCAKTDCTP